MPLTLAETPLYYKDSQGQYHRIMSGADMTGYYTAAEVDAKINSKVPLFRTHSVGSEPIVAGATREISYTIPSIAGYTPYVTSVHIPDTSNVNYAKVFIVWHQSGTTLSAHIFNTSAAQVAPSPRVECIYLPE